MFYPFLYHKPFISIECFYVYIHLHINLFYFFYIYNASGENEVCTFSCPTPKLHYALASHYTLSFNKHYSYHTALAPME